MNNNLLECSLLGRELETPVIVGSGPITDSFARIKKFYSYGVGAVIGKTIFLGEFPDVLEKVHVGPVGLFNSTTYSSKSIEEWQNILNKLNSLNHAVIPSLHADSPENLGKLASLIKNNCSYAVELGIACPNDGSQQKIKPSLIYDYTLNVRRQLNNPIIVKLAAVDDYMEYATAAIEAGADAISISDTIPSIVFDSTKAKYIFEEPAGYSGVGIKPIVLHAIYQLRKQGISCPIIGIGGIESANDVLEYLYVGANAVQVYTSLMLKGPELITSINNDLLMWCQSHNTSIKNLLNKPKNQPKKEFRKDEAMA